MVPIHSVVWKPSWRIIQDRYPRIHLYQRLSESTDWKALNDLEALTNPRIQQDRHEINILRPGDHFPEGQASYNVKAAFTHRGSSRFSDGRFGVYYTARTLTTAIAEKKHSTTLFMAATKEQAMTLRLRVLLSEIRGRLHDLRGSRKKYPDLYSARSYAASQPFGAALWQQGSDGIAYESVRHPGGECAAIFKPQLIHHPRQERCLQFDWNGRRIANVYELQEYPK